jgi:hypothetical protein
MLSPRTDRKLEIATDLLSGLLGRAAIESKAFDEVWALAEDLLLVAEKEDRSERSTSPPGDYP